MTIPEHVKGYRTDHLTWGGPDPSGRAAGLTFAGTTTEAPLDGHEFTVGTVWNRPVPCARDCLYTWGSNFGRRGVGTTTSSVSTPTPVAGLTGVTRLSTGQSIYALRSDGTVWAWGDSFEGALGNGSTGPALRPVRVPIPDTSQIVEVDGRRALDTGGTVWTWGHNGSGDLGIGHTWYVGFTPQRAHVSGVTALVGGAAVVPSP
ncbi:hypothetical protein [Actinophytocola xinjiangensis]|nr:hypothetical protein [Actinophytocola xinjiangensis]